MSTKIFHGMRKKFTSINEVYTVLNNMKKELKEIAYKEYVDLVASSFTFYYDMQTRKNETIDALCSMDKKRTKETTVIKVLKDDINIGLFNTILQVLNERHLANKNAMVRDTMLDFHLNLYFYPDKTHKNALLIIPEYEINEYYDVLVKYFDEYPYWDNVDKPKDFTRKEWDERGDIWIDGYDYGIVLSFSLYNHRESIYDFVLFDKNDQEKFKECVLREINKQSIKSRAEELARIEFINYKNPKDVQEYIDLYRKIKSGEYSEEFNKILSEKEKMLNERPKITKEILNEYKLPE